MMEAPNRFRLRHTRGPFTLDVDLALPQAGITAVLGPSGCGKTTLLRCVAGLERAEGLVEVHGERWQDESAFRPTWQRPLGYVFQEASLFDHLDVARNLAYAQKRSGGGHAGGLGLESAVDLLGIGHLLRRKPNELSGGERQRVAIARALATQPRLLLLDEPLAALDPARRREILPWLERMREQAKLPMLYVTHAIDEAARLADHLVVLKEGRTVASGPVEETLSRLDLAMAQDEDAGALILAAIAERDERWSLSRADFDGGSLWLRDDGLAIGTRVRLRALARDVSLARRPPEASTIQNVLDCTVEAVVPGKHPSQVLVRLVCGSAHVLARITARAAETVHAVPGERLFAQVKAVSVVG